MVFHTTDFDRVACQVFQDTGDLVHRLAYHSDVVRQAPDQLAVFQGGPSRTGGSEAPLSEGARRGRDGKTANWPRPRGVALKMGRRLSGCRRIGYVSILRWAPSLPGRLGTVRPGR